MGNIKKAKGQVYICIEPGVNLKDDDYFAWNILHWVNDGNANVYKRNTIQFIHVSIEGEH